MTKQYCLSCTYVLVNQILNIVRQYCCDVYLRLSLCLQCVQVLTIAYKLLTGSASGDLTLAVVQLVQHLGPLRFPPSFEVHALHLQLLFHYA